MRASISTWRTGDIELLDQLCDLFQTRGDVRDTNSWLVRDSAITLPRVAQDAVAVPVRHRRCAPVPVRPWAISAALV